MPQKVMVAGATGYIGVRVCQILYQKGYELIALVRPQSDKSSIEKWINKYIEGELHKKEDITDIIKSAQKENISYFIACVGAVNYHHHYELSKTINVETAKNIIDITFSLQKSDSFEKLVFIGSIASRGFLSIHPNPDEYIDESRDYYVKNQSVYSDVKKEAKTVVQTAIRNQNLKALIIEPGSLVGKAVGNKTTTSIGLINKVINGFPVLGGGASFISVYKVAEGIVLGMEKGRIGETYLLGGENLTMREFAFLVKKCHQHYFPKRFLDMIPVLIIPEKLSYLLGYFNIFLNTQQALLGNAFHYINDTKARKELGYTHTKKDLEEAIIETFLNDETTDNINDY